MADLDMIGELSGITKLSQRIDKPLRMLTESRGAKGRLALATKEPWGGAFVVVNTLLWEMYAFFPTTNIGPLVELAKIRAGSMATEQNGVFMLPFAGTTLYAAQNNQWAYFADSVRTLNAVAPDPRVFLGDLPKRYDLAFRLSFRKLPQDYRNEFVPRLRESAQLCMEQMEGESDEQYAARLNLLDHAIRQLRYVINDLDDVMLGWNLNTKEKSTHLDLEVTAKSGTALAERFAQIKGGRSDFAALLSPNAALSANVLGVLTDAQAGEIGGALADLRQSAAKEWEKEGLSENERRAASQFLDELVGVLDKTVKNKKLDAALSLSVDSTAATLLAGAKVADAATLDHSLRQLAANSPKDEKAGGQFHVKVEPYQGISLYAISFPTPDPGLVTLVGKRLEIVMGVAGDKLLVAAGRDALPRFKEAFDQVRSGHGKEVPPFQVRLAVPSIASLVATLSKNKRIKAGAAMLAGFGITAGSKNHLSFTLTPIARGFRARLEVEGGLLKMLGKLNQLTGWINLTGWIDANGM
jgi:hypothetical protein